MKLRVLVLVGALVGAATGVALVVMRLRREERWEQLDGDERRDDELLDRPSTSSA